MIIQDREITLQLSKLEYTRLLRRNGIDKNAYVEGLSTKYLHGLQNIQFFTKWIMIVDICDSNLIFKITSKNIEISADEILIFWKEDIKIYDSLFSYLGYLHPSSHVE